MLQKQSYPEWSAGADSGFSLTPSDIYAILKRRWLYFVVPVVLIGGIGSTVVALWPPTYVAAGKILVESQQIPTELVRPTVSTLASERIQVIEQRIMTRDNLLAIANKYRIFTGWRERLSGTEIVDFMRERTQIKPLDLRVPTRQPNRQTIAFTIGFEYERPDIAARVANELLTMILGEDVRTRTNYASETTRFLERESRKLETDLNATEVKIAEIKRRDFLGLPRKDVSPGEAQLGALKAELAQKSGVYSESHPDIKALKLRIAGLEKSIDPSIKDKGKSSEPELSLDILERQRDAFRKELDTTNQKLSAARQGESLERSQQSERLEVIEQPSLPQKPVSPNRPKLFALVLGLALAAGAALVFVMESLDGTIRRNADLLQVIDADLLVSIPYITTDKELAHTKWHVRIIVSGLVLAVIAMIGIAFVLLPMDDIIARITARFAW